MAQPLRMRSQVGDEGLGFQVGVFLQRKRPASLGFLICGFYIMVPLKVGPKLWFLDNLYNGSLKR